MIQIELLMLLVEELSGWKDIEIEWNSKLKHRIWMEVPASGQYYNKLVNQNYFQKQLLQHRATREKVYSFNGYTFMDREMK